MLFNSIEFGVFLPVVFLLYWTVFRRSRRLQNVFLFAASAFFYAWWDWRYLGLVFFSAGIDYVVALALERTDAQRRRKALLAVSLITNLGLLGFFKYYDFFITSFNEAFTLLGDAEEPAAMFMGVTDDHKWAVFAVDTARFESNGEHECKPTPERCEFVYLKVAGDGNETTFTTLDGQKSYDLELTAIKRIALDKEDVESVPTEDDKSDTPAAQKRAKSDAKPASLFDVLAKRR